MGGHEIGRNPKTLVIDRKTGFIVAIVKLGRKGEFVRLTNDQRDFSRNEFGICESRFFGLAPLRLWMLREDCIEVEAVQK